METGDLRRPRLREAGNAAVGGECQVGTSGELRPHSPRRADVRFHYVQTLVIPTAAAAAARGSEHLLLPVTDWLDWGYRRLHSRRLGVSIEARSGRPNTTVHGAAGVVSVSFGEPGQT
jgi:hypothetical protein